MEGTLERNIPATSSIPAEGESTEDESGNKAKKFVSAAGGFC